ncbi:DUF3261 domain-containing protein [Halomonas sp. M20]|uniref:DUF3261 domain-containing protein n=1 Tax=Halomonas sp. M20 TaxID=2763264 RepID=UPI001D0A0FFD|nr:DUF3261 domain-containing protein [Halomonas sp. M20]
MTNHLFTLLRPVMLLAALLALLNGCSLLPSTAPSPRFASLPLTDTLKRRLTFTPEEEPDKARTLIGLIRLEERELRVVFLTPYGQRLTTLVHDAEDSRFEEGDVPEKMVKDAFPASPAWLASRLEWSLWPVNALEEVFIDSPWTVSITGGVREIRRHGTLIARITPAMTDASREETVILDDRQGRYRLRIEPLEEPTS